MRHTIANRILAVLLSVTTALSTCMPATVALAESRDVQLQNHWRADGRTTVSGMLIGDVCAPRAGEALDDTARVEAEPNAAWDIPALWVSNDLALATKADEGKQGEAPAHPQKPSLIDIYCGQSARDALTDEDLEWFIDIIINTIEPQAVNYLVNKFPAFGAAAQNGRSESR